jgi:hypothetical protein
MKNVLFATTALVAIAGSAMAASHGGAPAISFSGDVEAGYNDEHMGGLYVIGDVGAKASVDMGGNITASVAWGGIHYDASSATPITISNKITAEFVYTGSSYTASLRLGDMNDKGASEYFYKDRSGMALDVENQDNHNNDVRALIQFGNYGIALGCGQPSNVTATTPNALGTLGACQGMNVGLGATFGSIKLGVGYDDAANLNKTNVASPRTAVSVDTTIGSIDLGLSYITDNTNNSIGVTVGKTFGSVKVGAYYAANSGLPVDAYGLSLGYASGAMDVKFAWDHAASDVYSVDASYAVSDALKFKAGYTNGSETVYTAAVNPGPAVKGPVVGSHYQVGVEYKVNSAISATLAYSNADGFGAAGYNQGISAFITASF